MLEQCPDCNKALAFNATTCRCGWKLTRFSRPEAPAQVQVDFAEQERVAKTQEEARRFMAKHGLKDAEDCKRYLRQQIRTFIRPPEGSIFERWCRSMNQSTVDWLRRSEGEDAKRLLRRLRAAAVIDDEYRLIQMDERAAVLARLQEERRAVEAELETVRQAMQQQGGDAHA
jgi:hypothetical protein